MGMMVVIYGGGVLQSISGFGYEHSIAAGHHHRRCVVHDRGRYRRGVALTGLDWGLLVAPFVWLGFKTGLLIIGLKSILWP